MCWGGRHAVRYLLSVLTLAVSLISVMPTASVEAAQITTRSLTLMAGPTDGGSKPGGVVKHRFTFTVPSSGNVGSIKLEYCTLAAGSCVVPTGLDTTSAAIGTTSTGINLTNVDNSVNGAPYFYAASPILTSGNTATMVQLDTVTNPTQANYTFFVRISTYASIDATGSPIDTGIVAAATASPIVLTGQMPESLIFCTGATVGTSGGVPDCSLATTPNINFNQLFSPSDTATATSQMAASTNAQSGYTITVNGNTLTSGSNTIAAMGTMGQGTHGVSQFGLNLKANSTATSNPAVGSEVAPASNGTNYRGQALTGYTTADRYQFNSGDSVADSSNGGSPGPTDSQIFTASYIVNVPGSQPAGTYSTTLTYICTPTF